MTYNLMNIGFLVPVLVFAFTLRSLLAKRAILWSSVAVLTATAIFDNYIIGSGIVAYEETAISGVRIGLAPIEDFGYAIAAIIGLPALWELLAARAKGETND